MAQILSLLQMAVALLVLVSITPNISQATKDMAMQTAQNAINTAVSYVQSQATTTVSLTTQPSPSPAVIYLQTDQGTPTTPPTANPNQNSVVAMVVSPTPAIPVKTQFTDWYQHPVIAWVWTQRGGSLASTSHEVVIRFDNRILGCAPDGKHTNEELTAMCKNPKFIVTIDGTNTVTNWDGFGAFDLRNFNFSNISYGTHTVTLSFENDDSYGTYSGMFVNPDPANW